MCETRSPTDLPRLSIVVAVAENGVIGNAGDLPWRLSGDLKRFKELTMGHALVMGRKTFESIGRALPGRVSIVLTRQGDYDPHEERVLVARTLDEACGLVATTNMDPSEVFVVGGAEIYRLAVPHATRLYRTVVHTEASGDTVFPDIEFGNWRLASAVEYPADTKNQFRCTAEVYERR